MTEDRGPEPLKGNPDDDADGSGTPARSGAGPLREYRQVLGIWLWFGLLCWGLWAVILAGPLVGWIGGGTDLLVTVASAWIVTSMLFAEVTRRQLHGRRRFALLRGVVRATSALTLLAMLASLAYVGLTVFPESRSLPAVALLESVLGPAWTTLAGLAGRVGVPPTLAGMATGPLLLFGLLVFARNALHWRLDRVSVSRRGGREAAGREATIPGVGSERDDDESRARAQAAARRVALSSYTQAKALLEATEVELTFLSLDVVGSTAMKQGEDSYVIMEAFNGYRKLVERSLRNFDAYKQTWTPDGQMAAFRSPQAAVGCGQEILGALEAFNEEVSGLKTDFALRVGANLGVVSTDDHTPMEEISDFSVDVAGHMQKYADTQSIWISGEVFEKLEDRSGFEKVDRQVDGRDVYRWRPGASAPPELPGGTPEGPR